MNDLKNLSEIRNLLAAHPFFTYDYADGLWINKDSKHLREFIQDEEQDEDMIYQYTATYNALEKWESDKRETPIFDSLAASELIRQLNK